MARSAYRRLLRAVKTHVTQESGNSQYREFLAGEFRRHKDLSDPAVIQHKLRLAEDYASLVNGVHYHKELLLSYNIGIDRVVDKSVRLKDTAGRVGLQLPTLFDEDAKK